MKKSMVASGLIFLVLGFTAVSVRAHYGMIIPSDSMVMQNDGRTVHITASFSHPFAQYTGNLFQGIVKLDGKAVPYAEVEVEYYNEDGRSRAPADYMVTQTIKADGNGVFTYAAPRAGWWGFAALNEADFTLKADGQDKGVELGAVIWVRFQDWKTK